MGFQVFRSREVEEDDVNFTALNIGPEHPARQLLDTVTATADDWFEGSDEQSNRPLAAKLEQLASATR